jgi:hypothetical protein
MVEGEALFLSCGTETPVAGGDLITIEPQLEHGLRTESRVVWICLG